MQLEGKAPRRMDLREEVNSINIKADSHEDRLKLAALWNLLTTPSSEFSKMIEDRKPNAQAEGRGSKSLTNSENDKTI